MSSRRDSASTERQIPLQLALDESFDYVVKRQRRKTIALHILADGGVEVRAPKWVPRAELAAFVEARSDWVVEQRRGVLRKLDQRPRFVDGGKHFYLGQQYPLAVSRGGRGQVVLEPDRLRITAADPADADTIQSLLQRWYRRQAESLFEERLFACYERFPDPFQDRFPMPEVKIRRMQRRWGSCSSRGVITLNLWMIKMPVVCIDYIVCHELCHLQEFHHGKGFYRLLQQVLPDWKALETSIDQYAELDGF